MTSNQFEVEIKYRLALLILYNLLKDEIITKDEWWSFILPLSPNQTFSYIDISFSNLL